MTPGEVLQRGREFAEDARFVDLKRLVGDLLVFGRLAEGELATARCVVVTAPVEVGDLGVVHTPWSRVRDPLAMSLTGWAVVRVAFGKRLVGPLLGDLALAEERLRALDVDPRRALYEQAASR